jgi:hypothetical protein
MNDFSISRKEILLALQTLLEPLPEVRAFWQGGAAAFNRIDEWSDLDLMVIAEDDKVDHVQKLIESQLKKLSPIQNQLDLPQPTWHGHLQSFYRLEHASPFLFIDLLIMQTTSSNRFTEHQIHGKALVQFDKGNYLSEYPLDVPAHLLKLRTRKQELETEFAFFQELTQKELIRQNWLDALPYFQRFTLAPIIELLRMQYSPGRNNFNLRYIYVDIPADWVQRIEPLFFLHPGKDFEEKFQLAQHLYSDVLADFNWNRVEENLNLD